MNKLRLDLDALAVDSFRVSDEQGGRGTVEAQAYTNTRPTCVYHCTYLGPTCEACARDEVPAPRAITQGANTCYDCTRFGCPGTVIC